MAVAPPRWAVGILRDLEHLKKLNEASEALSDRIESASELRLSASRPQLARTPTTHAGDQLRQL
jgi:hypothetical protein